MKPLSEQDSRKLFFDRIFGSEDACPSLLIKPSCEILERCGGLPLAIITMASMLACQPIRLLEGQWEHMQNTLASKFATDSKYEDMMHILDLSYKNLPRHLKACFLYLGSYPEDHLISRLELVRQWVAEGFVSTSGGQDVWDVAESYFNELVNRSMIQPQYTDFVTGVSFCKVHDMLLELIVRRCKEDNFLSLVNDSQAVVVEAQDKVIRRLTVVGLQGIDDGEGAITIAGNLSQICSLMILQGSNWVPPLAEFKFVRVLFLCVSYRHEMALDLTVINHLSHLKYLKVEGDDKSIVLPGQIRVGPLLDTLDLSRVTSSSISLEIVDVPRLSHLAVPKHSRLPDRICEVKSLRTLRGFSLPNDSLESIVGLSELTTLSELFLYCPAPLLPVPAAAWMGALSTSLEKLGSLKDLCLGPFQSLKPIALCADALSLLSPAFHNLEKLHLHSGCTFSRVPRWIGHLHSLRELWIGVKQLLREDVVLIGTRLPSLAQLGLRVAGVPLGRIVIGGSTGFPALKS
ncbi:hypothetical protein PVAP13_6KG009300 [Panicum virgatum]|nr:hypothetical protein PVAP13_6KG009300 [Panicum virgatum]